MSAQEAPPAKRAKASHIELRRFCNAWMDGDVRQVKQMLRQGRVSASDLRDDGYFTLTRSLPGINCVKLMRLLFKPTEFSGAGLGDADARAVGPALFRVVCREGNFKAARFMLTPRPDGLGFTAEQARAEAGEVVGSVCYCGAVDLMRLLLTPESEGGAGFGSEEARAGLGTVDEDSGYNQGLRIACLAGDVEMVQLLLKPVSEGGAGLGPQDLRDGDNVHDCDFNGFPILDALWKLWRREQEQNYLDTMYLLLTPVAEGGGGLTLDDGEEEDLLGEAIDEGNAEAVRRMLQADADPRKRLLGEKCWYARIACFKEAEGILKMLFAPNCGGLTAADIRPHCSEWLDALCRDGRFDTLRYLVTPPGKGGVGLKCTEEEVEMLKTSTSPKIQELAALVGTQ